MDLQALYLIFNYTSILRRVYGVGTDRVLHIHASAEARDNELILGHAWEPEFRASLNGSADVADMDTRLETNSIIDEYLCATFKASQKPIATPTLFRGTERSYANDDFGAFPVCGG